MQDLLVCTEYAWYTCITVLGYINRIFLEVHWPSLKCSCPPWVLVLST